MRVAYNAISLHGPLTGIGQYALQLALHLAKHEDLEMHMFYGAQFDRTIAQRSSGVQPRFRQLVRKLIPRAYDIAMWRRQSSFTRGAKALQFDLYHEPNFLAFEFDGPLVLTVHDLSWIRYPETHPKERGSTTSRAR